jgi:hypothetical protein
MADQAALMAGLQDLAEDGDPEQILAIASDWRQRLSIEGEALPALAELIKQVQLTLSGLRLTLNLPIVTVGAEPGAQTSLFAFRADEDTTPRRRSV